jgi:hypothetical protein
MKRRHRKLGNAEIALAMELRVAGMHWERIAEGLGVESRAVRFAIQQAEQYGMKPPQPVPELKHITSRNHIAAQQMLAVKLNNYRWTFASNRKNTA